MQIAVIGAGISGLTAAFHLQQRHDVTVFEARHYVGGHTHTVDVAIGAERHAIDTGFIVFNEQHYPRFTNLLNALGIASDPTDMSFSVRSDRTGCEYGSASVNALFAQRRNVVRPRFQRMIRDILRFHRDAAGDLPDDRITVAAYVADHRYSDAFVSEYLMPLGGSLWSSPARELRQFSMRFVIEFLRNHAMLQLTGQPVWRVIRGGSRRYVDALVGRFGGRVLVNRPVERVRRLAGRVLVTDCSGAEARFDHVVMACHADQSLRLLGDPSSTERDVLSAFPYQRNDVVLHTDARVLPRSRRAWASWNYHVPAEDRDAVSVTYNMNRLQGLRSRHVINVTLNDRGLVRPERVLQRFVYDHPVFVPGRDRAQRRHDELIDVNGTSFCGAYWGFGFHEDGVRSGLAVAQRIDRRVAA